MRILKLSRAGWLGRLCARATTRLARGAFTESGQSYDATFEAVAHGHSILERNSGFIAVYHPDGVHSLLITLYTRDGNQPRLRAKGFGENPNSITFVFQDITNWKKGTEHIHGLELFF